MNNSWDGWPMVWTPKGWKPADLIKYSYPEWIKLIPFRWLRIKIRRVIYDGEEAYFN